MSVHRKGQGWVVRWREDGKQRSRSFTTKREAVEFDERVVERMSMDMDVAVNMVLLIGDITQQMTPDQLDAAARAIVERASRADNGRDAKFFTSTAGGLATLAEGLRREHG